MKCAICDKSTFFSKRQNKYLLTCSRKCRGKLVSLDPFVKEKKRRTCLKKYGVENPQQNKEIRDRTSKTCLLLYGQSGFNIQQALITNLEKYGVENPQQNKEIRDRTAATNIKRYGQDGFNPVTTKMTMMERYGVENALQNPEIFERCHQAQIQSRYKFKSFLSPSGKTIWYQGYEKFVLEYLYNLYDESDITNERFEVPTIKYEFNGKSHTYFPDIYIKSINHLIEVKSTYTFDAFMDLNLAKQKAAEDLGYNHSIIIWSPTSGSIDQIIPDRRMM